MMYKTKKITGNLYSMINCAVFKRYLQLAPVNPESAAYLIMWGLSNVRQVVGCQAKPSTLQKRLSL